MTAFARFLIFLVIFSPIAYLGASYYQGEDGLESISRLLKSNTPYQEQIQDKKSEIIELEKRINKLKADISTLEQKSASEE